MPLGVYTKSGIYLRDHCGAEPAGDLEPFGLVGAVGGRDRASASDDAAYCVEAPARTARRWVCGIFGGRTETSLPAET